MKTIVFNVRYWVIDLSPIIVTSFKRKGLRLQARDSVKFFPYIDENGTYYVEDPSLGIFVFARTREKLQEELEEQLMVVWREYVKSKDKLSQQAKNVKTNLLGTFNAVLESR
jgi:hypothetical protein